MTARRLDIRSHVDRSKPLSFTFDGVQVNGFEGDTIASALLANDMVTVGRSFKYHRPRGIWGAWSEEPNALVNIRHGESYWPVTRATMEPARDGMEVTTTNGTNDPNAWLDKVARFIPAAFYYKTFMWPSWHAYEPRIRRMAGLGHVDGNCVPKAHAKLKYHACDMVIVGAGLAGLFAASAASRAGKSVLLVDDQFRTGGSLLDHHMIIEGIDVSDWLIQVKGELAAGNVTILQATTAYGIYDHNLVALNQRHLDGRPDTGWRVRAGHIVLATGAIERPLVFADNDRPGIMSAEAAQTYLSRYSVLAGRTVGVFTNNDSAYGVADAYVGAGASVTVFDTRGGHHSAAYSGGADIIENARLDGVSWTDRLKAVQVRGRQVDVDCLLVSGGWTPTVHLYCQAGGKLKWLPEVAGFVPETKVPGLSVIGSANGSFDMETIVEEALAAARQEPPLTPSLRFGYNVEPVWHDPGQKGRAWVDYQNDVTIKDVELAHRENFRSVEHLKRYTTLGMATDQGKTSNVNGLAAMASLTGQTIGQVGTTTYRPPFNPVPLATIAGWRAKEFLNPIKRLPLENWHRQNGAVFREYGGWLRPAYYGSGPAEEEIQREARQARQSVGLFDGSTLGKIEVIGPDAARFLDFHYYNTISTLKDGNIRYGFMLTEGGVVYDDGVVARLSDSHFVVSCSSSHADGVHRRLEAWRQDGFDPGRVFIHNTTAQWATLTLTGPLSRQLLETLPLGVFLADELMPHMAIRNGRFKGSPVRISRVSFSGDRCYEIAIPADKALQLWQALEEAGKNFWLNRTGLEAMSILRAEKGYIIVGKDTDGTTMPMDLGMSAPFVKKRGEYIGKRSLMLDMAHEENRQQLVGLTVEGQMPLATGAHAIKRSGRQLFSIGYVTSSYYSPNLERPIALALIESGNARIGQEIEIFNQGKTCMAKITPTCALDPAMERLNA